MPWYPGNRDIRNRHHGVGYKKSSLIHKYTVSYNFETTFAHLLKYKIP